MRAFIVFAAVGFGISTIAHLATFTDIRVSSALEHILFGAVFVVFAAALIAANRILKEYLGPEWNQKVWYCVAPKHRQLFVLLLFYGVFNILFTSLYLNEGGVPSKNKGQLALVNHGVVIRELTPEQFAKHKAYSTRRSLAVMMLFYVVSLGLLLACERAKKASEQS